MVDISKAMLGNEATSLNDVCGVYQDIAPDDLKKLLATIAQGLRYEGVVNIDAKIDPEYLKRDFIPGKGDFFHIDPTTEYFPRRTLGNQWYLSRRNVAELLESIAVLLYTRANERRWMDEIEKVNDDRLFLDRLRHQGESSIYKTLKDDSFQLLTIITKLYDLQKQKPAEVISISQQLPAWLSTEHTPAQQTSPNQALHNWTVIQEAIEAYEKAIKNYVDLSDEAKAVFKGIKLRASDNPFSAAPLREFFNTWLGLLYQNNGETKIELKPSPEYFSPNSTLDKPDVPSQKDQPSTTFFKEVFNAVEDFLSAKVEKKKEVVTAEMPSGEGGDTVITEEIKTQEDLDSIFKKFEESGVNYRIVSDQLTQTLLLHFFNAHEFQANSLDELKLNLSSTQERIQFEKLQAEFSIQLRNYLSSLTPEEIGSFQSGGKVDRLREFYGQLVKSRFFQLIQVYVETQADKAVAGITDPNEKDKKKSEFFKKHLDVDFDSKITQLSNSTQAGEAFSQALSLSDLAALNSATRADFQTLLINLQFPSSEHAKLFSAIEAFVAEKHSPERIRDLELFQTDQFRGIFGFDFPQNWLNSGVEQRAIFFNRFKALCAKYAEIYKQKLSEHYGIDLPDLDDDNNLQDLAPAQLAELEATRGRVLLLKGGAQSIIIGRAITYDQVEQFEAGNLYGQEIADEYAANEAERINKEKTFFLTLSPQDKLDFLRQMGLLPTGPLRSEPSAEEIEKQINTLAEEWAKGLSAYDYLSGEYSIQEAGNNVGDQNQARALPYSRDESEIISPLDQRLSKRSSLSATKIALGIAKKAWETGTEFAGRAITSSIPGANLMPKEVQRGIGATALTTLALAIAAMLSSALAVMGAVLGSILGALLGTALLGPLLGPAGTIIGAAMGGAGGAFGDWVLDKSGILSSIGHTAGGLFANGSGTAGLGASTAAPSASALGLPSTAISLGLGTVTTIAVLHSTIAAAFLPPAVGSAGASQYVDIQKTADPGDNFGTPQDIKYTVTIQPKTGYTIDVTNITDTFSFAGNSSKRQDQKTDPALPTSPINLDALKKKNNGSTQIASPTKISFDPYTAHYDNTFHDASIANTVSLKFTIINQQGLEPTAQFTKSVCFGDCPKTAGAGCWPATGKIVWGPFEVAQDSTHNYYSAVHKEWIFLDAVDIFNNLDTPIYAPFDGMAGFYSENEGDGAGGLYGNHVELQTGKALLFFAHMQEFANNYQPGETHQVHVGDVLGYMGGSGVNIDSWPVHLHYEYRPAQTGNSASDVPTQSNLQTIVPEPIQYRNQWQVTGTQQVVSACVTSSK